MNDSNTWNIVYKNAQGDESVVSIPLTLDRARQSLRDLANVSGHNKRIEPVFSGEGSDLTAVIGKDVKFLLRETYPAELRTLHDMTKDELIGIVQDYQEMVSDIESILNANPKMPHRQEIRDIIYKE